MYTYYEMETLETQNIGDTKQWRNKTLIGDTKKLVCRPLNCAYDETKTLETMEDVDNCMHYHLRKSWERINA